MSEKEPLCNLCGLTCNLGQEGHPAWGAGGLIKAQVSGGYESTPGNGCGTLDDGTRYHFNLCEFCIDWLFQQFNLPPRVDSYFNDYLLKDGETLEEGMERMDIVQLAPCDDPDAWKPAAQRVAEDDWRKMKKRFFDEKNRRDLARVKNKN